MRLLGIACALLFSLTVAAVPAAAAQDDAGDFLARPGPGASTSPEGGYYVLESNPGDVVTQQLELRNDSTEPIELRLAAVDAVTGPLGGASYGLATDETSRTGTWITLGETSVQLEPGASARIPFTVRVPDDARSGEHLAGLSVAPVQDEQAATGADAGAGASVDIQTRRVVAVQVNLPGPSEPELSVSGVRSAARPQGLYLEIDIDNIGTALARAEGTISVPDDDFTQTFTIDTFVPGTSIAYPIAWPTEPQEGSHQASVEIRYGGRTATWDGEVVVGEEVLEDLADREVQPAGASADESSPALGWLPWAVGALGVTAAGVVGYAFARRTGSRPRDSRPRPRS